MRTHTFGAMKRALATLLALALAVSLPALAEDLTLGPEEAPALEVIDGGELSIDLLPELSDDLEIDDVDLELPDVLSLSPEAAGPEGLADNSSKPIPELQEYIFRRNVTGDSGITINKKIVERRPGDIAVSYADVSKAKALLGWETEYDLRAMCAHSWNWQKNNPKGYED